MTKKKLSAAVCMVIAAATVAACLSSPAAPGTPAVVTLAPGQTREFGGLALTFVGVTSDTRCPADAMCIQMGDAIAAFNVLMLGGHRTFELHLLTPAKRSTTHGDFVIELTDISPYPLASRPTTPADYRATVKVDRKISPAAR